MKSKYFIGLVFSLILLTGCEGSTYWREKHGLIKTLYVDFIINNIRVDDDGEYHIVAVSPSGTVKTMSDENVGFGIELKYSNIPYPTLRVHYADRNEAGVLREDIRNLPEVILPFGYKIETFND